MGLFDAILKDEAYENTVMQLQTDTLASKDTSGPTGGASGGSGTSGGAGNGGGAVSSGGASNGAGGSGGSGTGGSGNSTGGSGASGGSGGSGNGASTPVNDGIIILDSTPISPSPSSKTGAPATGLTTNTSEMISSTSASAPTVEETDPLLSLTEEPLIIMDETPSIAPLPLAISNTTDSMGVEPTLSVNDVTISEENTPEPLPITSEAREVYSDPKEFETSPAGVLEESIDKLKELEAVAERARTIKLEEEETYKNKMNESKVRAKEAEKEAAHIEGEIHHIEEMIVLFQKELEKEKPVKAA